MTRRDPRLLLGLAALTLLLACLTLVGVHSDVLLAVPALALALPLLAGRYVGEERLARLAAAFVVVRRRAAQVLAPAGGRPRHRLPRGGRLIAFSLAVRPPPPARPALTV